MEIDRKDWHYKVYSFWWDKEKPENFWSYSWKTVLAAISIFSIGAVFLIFAVVAAIVLLPTGWFFGFWPNVGEHGDSLFHRYKFDGRKNHRFAPWEIVLPLAIGVGLPIWVLLDWPSSETAVIMAAVIELVIIAVIGLPWLLKRIKKTETWKLFAECISAKKRKVCPRITFK
ncbi:MAG: hypothetical protein WC514_03225 [Candidatus Paceibacterota bacterium]